MVEQNWATLRIRHLHTWSLYWRSCLLNSRTHFQNHWCIMESEAAVESCFRGIVALKMSCVPSNGCFFFTCVCSRYIASWPTCVGALSNVLLLLLTNTVRYLCQWLSAHGIESRIAGNSCWRKLSRKYHQRLQKKFSQSLFSRQCSA